MSIHKIQKQKLLNEPLSDEAIKLALAIYNTYLENEDLEMQINISKLFNLFKLHATNDSLAYIKNIFMELTEPIIVKNFKFYNNLYPMRIVTFCIYTFHDKYVNIELSEEFLEVEKNYMIDNFLTN
ncbi:MAG: hypothetical protein OQJ77_02175 [Thiovulaceae bacterium]|nr:hypothetical protein [Sulfurimonadaceae bacterium]MCW9026099.1 hypothetical protein [Sulfurimonadaceae bacterium]